MPSFKTKNVFKSRWNAVFWSASVLLTAYCSVPASQDPKTAAHDNAAAEKLVKHFTHHKHAEKHVDPWAK